MYIVYIYIYTYVYIYLYIYIYTRTDARHLICPCARHDHVTHRVLPHQVMAIFAVMSMRLIT